MSEWPYGSGVWGKKEWVLPQLDSENVVSMHEGDSNLFWADRYGRQLGLGDLWVKQCGTSHTGSFKDLGMTVLVSMVKQMIAAGQADPRDRLRVDRRHLGGARGLCRRGGDPRGGDPAARQGLARAARPAARRTARSCSRSTRTSTAAWRSWQELAERDGVYLANSMNSLRIEGQKTVAIEIVSSSAGRCPTGS